MLSNAVLQCSMRSCSTGVNFNSLNLKKKNFSFENEAGVDMYSGSPNNQENTVFVIYLQLYVLSLGRWKNHPGHLSVHVSAGAKLCS